VASTGLAHLWLPHRLACRIVGGRELLVQTNLVDTLVPEPEPGCLLHPDVGIGPSPIAQLGLFARVVIAPGAIVSRLGGRLVTGSELQQIFCEAARRPDHPYVDAITADDDLHLVLPPGQPNHYGNHSCDPNLWWADAYTLVARRPIEAEEEVTSDYATSTGNATSPWPAPAVRRCAGESSLVMTGACPNCKPATAATGYLPCLLAYGRAEP
jgi:uncharacterized protein